MQLVSHVLLLHLTTMLSSRLCNSAPHLTSYLEKGQSTSGQMEPELKQVLSHVLMFSFFFHWYISKTSSRTLSLPPQPPSSTTTYFLLFASSSPSKCEGQKASNGTKVSTTHLRQNTPVPKLLSGYPKYHCPLTTRLISSHADSNSFQSMVISGQQANRYGQGERIGLVVVILGVCVEEELLDTFFTPLDIENADYTWAFSMSKGAK